MRSYEDWGGSIYVEHPGDFEEFIADARFILGKEDKSLICKGCLSPEYRINELRKFNTPTDIAKFLNYKYELYFISVERDGNDGPPADPEFYLDLVVRLIKYLRSKGCLVVAACEFEDLIIERTGTNEDLPYE